VKKSVAFDKASASKKDVEESLIEVGDGNHTDRVSINQKDHSQDNDEMTFNQVKNFHS